jgi:hypothetical protein
MPDDDRLPRSLERSLAAGPHQRHDLAGDPAAGMPDHAEPWRRMVSEFPELINVTSLTQQEVVRLYRAYVEEWGSNEDAVRARGSRGVVAERLRYV